MTDSQLVELEQGAENKNNIDESYNERLIRVIEKHKKKLHVSWTMNMGDCSCEPTPEI